VGSGVVAPFIHNLSTRCKCLVSFTSLPLHPGWKRPRYTLNRRLSVPQIRSGRFGQNKNLLTLPGIEPQFPGRPAQLLLVSKGSCSVVFSHLQTKTQSLQTNLSWTVFKNDICIHGVFKVVVKSYNISVHKILMYHNLPSNLELKEKNCWNHTWHAPLTHLQFQTIA